MTPSGKPPPSGPAAASRSLPLVPDSPIRQTIRRGIERDFTSGLLPAVALLTNWKRAEGLAAGCFQGHPPACASGCAHCCHTRVGLDSVEARTLAHALGKLPPDRLAAIQERITKGAARAKGTSASTYPRLRCALLDDQDRCSMYDVRPFVCRRAHSFDADACRRGKEGDDAVGLPVDVRVIGLYQEIATAFREVCAGLGGDPELYELHQVLAILLAKPKATRADLAPARALGDEADDASRAAGEAAMKAVFAGGASEPDA